MENEPMGATSGHLLSNGARQLRNPRRRCRCDLLALPHECPEINGAGEGNRTLVIITKALSHEGWRLLHQGSARVRDSSRHVGRDARAVSDKLRGGGVRG